MRYRDKRYVAGALLIALQYLFFRAFCMGTKIEISLRNVSFFLFIFLYMKERLYIFETRLIWEELRKQLKCYFEFIVIIGIIIHQVKGMEEMWKYFLLGTSGFIYSFILVKMMRKIFNSKLKTNLVIVGTGETAKDLTDIIEKNGFTMYNLEGYLHTDNLLPEKQEIDKNMILGSYEKAEFLLKNKKIDEIIIALPELSDKQMNKVVDILESNAERIKFIPRINKMYTLNPQIQDYDGVMLISAKNNLLSRKRQAAKRILDILGALAGMGLLLPLYFIFGRKIKADGGKALFSHNRIGKGLEPFKMHKFRSMYIDAEERLQKMLEEDQELREEFYKNFKLKNDPRITPVGDFLRRTSLDEFPQFLNVLKGEMSLVGPRPVVQKEVDMYYGDSMGKKVFQAKPGITGMWQANGRSDIEDYEERIALDLYYIRNWSVWLDIVILFKTVKNVIGKKGAY